MFKSIDYKLYFYISLLIIAVGLSVYFFLGKEYAYAIPSLFLCIFSLNRLYFNYKKYNSNILFLLNAIDNGDYSFNFAETKLSRREKELNQMMNRIKEILSRARQEVIEKEKFLSLIIEDVPTGIVIVDGNNNVRNANKTVCNILGLPVFTHLNQLKVIDPKLPDIFRNAQVGEENVQISIPLEKDIAQISIGVSKIKIQDDELRIISLNNIGSELEKREMDSWIKLIRVITHEIMNSIAPITSLSEMLLYSYQSNNEEETNSKELNDIAIDSLSTINTTAKGLSAFVESYRQFSGIAKPALTEIELIPFINSILNLEKAEIESNAVQITIETDIEDIFIFGDKIQLTRVVVNLIKNAIEALENQESKMIKINIQSETNDKINISIANNGSPIPPDVLENIFIPFFTTKETGSGIGLSISRYIMRLHEGNLKHFYSDGWTVFSLTLKKTPHNH